MSISPHFVEPACPHFGICGGCTQQHLSSDDYLAYKNDLVTIALTHQGLEHVTVERPIIFPPHSRRRCNLKALRLKDRVLIGYHELRTHNIVDISVCPLVVPEIERLLDPLRSCLALVLKPKQKADLFLALTDQGVDLLLMIDGVRELEFEQSQALIALASNENLARVLFRYKDDAMPVVAFRNPTITYGGVPVEIEPDAFMQASQLSDHVLIRMVMDAIPDTVKRAADLFCGRGTYTLPLSQRCKVDAFELDYLSIGALERAKNKNQRPIRTFTRNLFEDPLSTGELDVYDYVVINPPRAGALKQSRQLAVSRIPILIMVSCDPKTFSRDARVLIDGGYNLKSVTPVDQFLWSNHIEVVGIFTR